jgi:hypothetical protein
VALPKPEPGLVISYEYLWRHEHEGGRDHGSKVRPCAIVVAVERTPGATEVVVAPITHLEPLPPSEGIEIPPRVKRHLGLDEDRSWVIVTDLNVFTWPGYDLYPVPTSPTGAFSYGFLPPKLHRTIVGRIIALGNAARVTDRNEKD